MLLAEGHPRHFSRAIYHLFRGKRIADTRTTGDIMLVRLTFTEVKAMVCLSQETYQKLRFPIFARADSPRV